MENALQVLTLLVQGEAVGVTDVARELHVARSTAHRLLATLRDAGFAIQGRDRRYRVGPSLSSVVLAPQLRPALQRLVDEVDETVHLMVLEGARTRFIDSVEAKRPLRVGSRIGLTLPAHLTSGGKVLLAELDDDMLRTVCLEATSEAGHALDVDALEVELAEVRRTGYAINLGESEPDISAVAAPIRDYQGRALAAMAIAAPSARMEPASTERWGRLVQDAANRASADLWRPNRTNESSGRDGD